jgi:hypothetical protein
VNANVSYTFMIGKRTGAPGGITGISLREGVATVMTGTGDTARYRLSINASIQDLTNTVNLSGYNGTMTSPFFRTPTSAMAPRKVDVGINFSF